DSPPCIAILALKYASLGVREEICRSTLEDRTMRCYEKIPCHWIKEVIENEGLYPNGAEVLAQFLNFYPLSEIKSLILYFSIHHPANEPKYVLALRPEPCWAEVQQMLEDVTQYVYGPIAMFLSKGVVRIPFRGNQRDYFMHLFLTHALDRPESFLIAAD